MEKVGGIFNNDKMQQKGAEKRAGAGAGGYGDESTQGGRAGYGGNDQSDY